MLGQNVFPNLELWASKIDEQTVLFLGCSQVSQELSGMLAGESFDRFELHNKLSRNQKIDVQSAEEERIFVKDLELDLLLDRDSCLAESMNETVFVNLFFVSML